MQVELGDVSNPSRISSRAQLARALCNVILLTEMEPISQKLVTQLLIAALFGIGA
jgi:hypothetical protein